ncbi:uncharacterized protein VTP21DRAFT_10110 [Calcarisporiella thermophila]|uniref:uncharacterized protein n=1 Tax=Calcarisporiella thermophila TaxID=911321 RepID=UPI0037447760
MTNETGPRRVKVYQLDADNTWIDKGTGQCVFIDSDDEAIILVRSEDDNSVLLQTKIINKEDTYQKQQESLIVWTEEDGTDLALSFQEAEGCAEIWDRISTSIRSIPSQSAILTDTLPDSPQHSPTTSPLQLPEPELSNLSEIEAAIKDAVRSHYERDKLVSYIVSENYIKKLIPFLEICEDLESLTDLHTLCIIMKSIICLNDATIIESIVQDDLIMGVVGILEYDPDFPSLKANHREFLTKNSKFKQVLPIKDKSIELKIHQTFRLQYLKDVVLARTLDDPTFSILSSLIFCNHVDIVQHLKQNHEFLKDLFAILNSPSESDERKRDVIFFVQQFCAIAKTLNLPNRSCLYRALSQYGLFRIFDHALPDEDPTVKMAGLEILASVLEQDPNLVRSYILAQVKQEKKPLIETILHHFHADSDIGLKAQYAEIIRVLLDTTSSFGENILNATTEAILNPKHDPEADEFLTLFYDRFTKDFTQLLMDLPDVSSKPEGHSGVLKLSRDQATQAFHLCELLSFMIRQHTFRSKYFILSSNLLLKVALLLRSREKHLKLAALRVLRTCVGLMDEFYNRHIKKNNLLEPVVVAFIENGNRSNLLNSASLELFEFIRKENIKSLVEYLAVTFRDKFKRIDYVDTFNQLLLRYEQNTDTSASDSAKPGSSSIPAAPPGAGHEGWASATVDEDEEAYFNTSDEDESGTKPTAEPLENTSSEISTSSASSVADQPSEAGEAKESEESSQNEAENGTGPGALASEGELELPKRLEKRQRGDDDEDQGFTLRPSKEVLSRIKTINAPKKLRS